jgi:hypothetical protein
MLDKRTTSDVYGGYTAQYVDGAAFKAAVTFNTSLQAKIAEKQGVTSLYTVTTSKSFMLEYHDVFKRIRDNKIFRVTSNGDDKYTPESASLDMRLVTAEEFVISGDTNG